MLDQLPDLEPWRWLLAGLAALLIGFAKSGVPGAGILFVPLMVSVFGARLSVGATLPLLLLGDLLAVLIYRAHADVPTLRRLAPWVGGGLGLGAGVLWGQGRAPAGGEWLGPLIGTVILALLGLTLLQRRGALTWRPHSPASVASVGTLTGLTTMVANAAGPITGLYLSALGQSARTLVGTSAWLYLLINLCKGTLLLILSLDTSAPPLFTAASLWANLALAPLVVVGALLGRAALPRLREETFTTLLLVLAGVAAVKLLFPG